MDRLAGTILVLCHKRVQHLSQVIHSLEVARGIEKWEVLFCAQDPSSEVLDVIRKADLKNSETIIRNLAGSNFSTKKSINSNLYFGLEEIFIHRDKKFAVVLEDDVVVTPEFLNYIAHFLQRFEHDRRFRGVNSVSSYRGQSGENGFGLYSQGLMFGWGLTKKQFFRMRKFWSGSEDAHWDYYVEPYVRTGFVVNPLFSMVRNIGFDETASHSKSDPGLVGAIEESMKCSLASDSSNWKESKIDFRMRKDFIPLSRSSKVFRFKTYFVMTLSFLIYYSGIKAYRWTHYISRKIRNCFLTALQNDF